MSPPIAVADLPPVATHHTVTSVTNDDARDRADLQRAAQGDEAALVDLYHRWWPRLHTYGLKVGRRDEAAAEDVASAAFVRALLDLRAGHFPAPGETVAHWLFSRATGVYFREVRGREVATEFTAHVPASETYAPDTFLQEDGGRDREIDGMGVMVRFAVAQLPSRQRDAVTLTYYEGLPAPEVATRIGATPARLGSILSAARDAIWRAVGRPSDLSIRGAR